MFSFSRSRALLATCGIVLVLVAIGTLIYVLGKHGENIGNNDSEFFSPNISANNSSVATTSEHQPTIDTESIEDNGDVGPRTACEDPLGVLSDKCLQSLDTYFVDQHFAWNGLDWFLVPMTYRRIFADPDGDREKVLAALDRAACRLEEGQIRWDLKESCNAESFANYANFIHFCQHSAPVVRLLQEGSVAPSESETMDARLTTFEVYEDWDEQYKRSSRWAGERLLEGRWIVEKKCKEHSARTLTWDYIHDSEYFERLKEIGIRFELFSDSWGSSSTDAFFHQISVDAEKTFVASDAFQTLRALAARLGDEWAASVYVSNEEDDAWNAHEIESLPWKQSLRIMQAGIYWNRENLGIENASSFENVLGVTEYLDISLAMGNIYSHRGDNARVSALAFGLNAWDELDRAGIEIDVDRLVEYICDPSWAKSSLNCQESIAELSKTNSPVDQYYWHRLSEFKTRSIELGLYDTDSTNSDPDWERKALGVAEPFN